MQPPRLAQPLLVLLPYSSYPSSSEAPWLINEALHLGAQTGAGATWAGCCCRSASANKFRKPQPPRGRAWGTINFRLCLINRKCRKSQPGPNQPEEYPEQIPEETNRKTTFGGPGKQQFVNKIVAQIKRINKPRTWPNARGHSREPGRIRWPSGCPDPGISADKASAHHHRHHFPVCAVAMAF